MRDVRAVPPLVASWLAVADRWWAALSSGRFYTVWSAVVALPVAATLLGSFAGVTTTSQAVAAVLLSAAGWVPCCLLVLPAAWAERRLRSGAGRAVVVLGALVLVSAARPLVNDVLTGWCSARPIGGDLPVRMVMNFIVWLLLLSMVAVAVDATATARVVNRRLRGALAALAGGDAQSERDLRGTRALVRRTVDDLRAAAERLRTGTVDFERVRAFSEIVREASHRLDDRADAGLLTDDGDRRTPLLARLQPPPVGMVGGVFMLSSLPYAVAVLPLWQVVASALSIVGIAVVGDLCARWLSRGRSARTQGAVVIAVAALVGAAVSAAMLPWMGHLGLEWLVPLPGILILTMLAAVAQQAIERTESEQRSLTAALSAIRAAETGPLASAAELLHRAADRLHGEVQSRCVVFAAGLDDAPASPAEVDDFVDTVHARLDRVLAPQAPPDADALAALIAAWSKALEIRCEIDPHAAAALTDPAVSARVADIASEAFVNAVKHSGAKEASVVVRRRAPGTLSVCVAAPGRLRLRLRPGIGLARLGVPARLAQRGRDVVLSASIPSPESDGMPAATDDEAGVRG